MPLPSVATIEAAIGKAAMKTCNECSVEKSIEEYYRYPRNSDGRNGKCKDCWRTRRGCRKRTAIVDGKKLCSKCEIVLPVENFYPAKTKLGRATWCKSCMTKWRRGQPKEYFRARERRRKYGITSSEYARMVAECGGHCACCGGDPSARGLHVDHDHATGAVRGLLCNRCNHGIGFFRDDPSILRLAAEYLIRYAARSKG